LDALRGIPGAVAQLFALLTPRVISVSAPGFVVFVADREPNLVLPIGVGSPKSGDQSP
jgi:hypothetical protein